MLSSPETAPDKLSCLTTGLIFRGFEPDQEQQTFSEMIDARHCLFSPASGSCAEGFRFLRSLEASTGEPRNAC